jgi:hypothetical protein
VNQLSLRHNQLKLITQNRRITARSRGLYGLHLKSMNKTREFHM